MSVSSRYGTQTSVSRAAASRSWSRCAAIQASTSAANRGEEFAKPSLPSRIDTRLGHPAAPCIDKQSTPQPLDAAVREPYARNRLLRRRTDGAICVGAA